MKSSPLLVLLAVGGVWGTSFLFIKVIVEEIAPLELVAGRLLIGAASVALVVVLMRRPVRLTAPLLAKLSVLALFTNILPFALIAWAEVHIDSGVTSVLNSTMPLFTALFAAAILAEEHFTTVRVLGLVTGFVGVAVLTGGDITRITDDDVLGELAVVGAATCYGAGAVYLRTLLRSEDPVNLSVLQLGLSALMAIPIALLFEGLPDGSLSVKGWLALLALGIGGTGLAYIAYVWLVDNIGSVRSSLVTYIIPVIGLLLGWAVLDEELGLSTILGFLLILGGVAAVLRGEAPASERVAPVPAGAAD
ncbi:MAG: DMT family transporter [Dehalococcoidia bacterium]|nr:DMT family transporter [Dehalococcoidia bacterium]MDZ4277947.1 DMT family transporter [Dehalococcoidia bacterium]